MSQHRTRPNLRRLAAAWLLVSPALAVAQTATVDQVLAAVAEVVRDRAKRVALHTIQRNLEESLCSGTVELPRAPIGKAPAAAPAASASATPAVPGEGPLILYLGGRESCRKGYVASGNAAAPDASGGTVATLCKPDDVFVRTCRAIGQLEIPLTDPYLLKSLSRDTVDFLVRVSARDLDEPTFVESGLVEVGAFIHAALEQLGHEKPRPGELAGTLLALADRLSAGVQARSFTQLERSGAPAKLETLLKQKVVDRWVADRCSPSSKTCQPEWFKNDCDAYVARSGRDQVFNVLFEADPAPLKAAKNAACNDVFSAPSQKALLEACWKARLTYNLYGSLVRGRCVQGDQLVRSAFRELSYVVTEQLVYRDALRGLLDEANAPELDAFLDAVQRLDLSDLPREELAAGVRFIGSYLAALELSPGDTAQFAEFLAEDVGRVLRSPGPGAYAAVLHGKALGTDSKLQGPGIGALRGVTKDLITLPAFAVVRYQREIDQMDDATKVFVASSERARASLVRLLQNVVGPGGRASYRDSMGALAQFVSDLADVTAEMSKLSDVSASAGQTITVSFPASAAGSSVTARALLFQRASLAMKQGAIALQLAADRDWVGLAVQVSDEIARRGGTGNVQEIERSMRFVRVLLSMYQAPSVDDAKKILEGSLDDEGSRERRYDAFTWDFAALLGFRGGMQYARADGFGSSDVSRAKLFGVTAPFGLQIAKRWWGVLAYPVDLGSYLTATGEPSGSTTSDAANGNITWSDAFRFGATTYWRPSAGWPVVIGLGADFRPAFEDAAQWRWYGTVAMELPLFAVH